MPAFTLKSHPAAESHRLLDFDSVDVTPGFVTNTYFLTVRGKKPCINMEVTLAPRIYINCPAHWGIEVVGHLPRGVCLPALGQYEQTIALSGITGSTGIEVIGATKTDQRKVAGGCDASLEFTQQSS